MVEFILLKIGIYLRVSTKSQEYDSQLQIVTDYCKTKGYNDLEFFSEKISGAKSRRPELTNLIENAQKGTIKKVVIYKLDRLGRSLADLINTIHTLTACGCDFVSVSDNIDTSQDSPFARLQLGLLASIAEFERNLIKQRVVAGLKAARAKGRIGGRPGLEQTVKDKINHMLKEGFHSKAIARECGVSVGSVYKQRNLVALTS